MSDNTTIVRFIPTPEELATSSKKELEAQAIKLAKSITEAGALSELEVYIRSKKLTDFATALAKAIKSQALEEARKEQSKGKFSKFGAEITHTSTGTKWHYGNCGDPRLKKLEQELDKLKEKISTRQAYLQGIPEEGEVWIDPDSGEEVLLRRAVKTSTEDISIKY